MTVQFRNKQGDVEIADLGQVDSLFLPDGWRHVDVQLPSGNNAFYREYCLKDNPGVKLCFYYRGQRTTSGTAEAFSELLGSPPHELTEFELNHPGVLETLRNRDAGKGFTVTDARTCMLGGKLVLAVQGYFAEAKPVRQDVYAIYIDSDGTGSAVQEIYFQAPQLEYAEQIDFIQKSLAQIRWK
jgi:hypothetical protein